MKHLFYNLCIVIAATTWCIQAEDNIQPVRASKADKNDKQEVTVIITEADGKTTISKASFKQNTDRFGGKLRGKSGSLWFDWSNNNDLNTVIAYYNDEPNDEFGIPVFKENAPAGSELVIDKQNNKNIIRIKPGTTKVQKKELTTIPAVLKVEGQGIWKVVSGTNRLTSNIAEKFLQNPVRFDTQQVLAYKVYDSAKPQLLTIPLSSESSTRIYAHQITDGFVKKLTTLNLDDVTSLRSSDPVVMIVPNGTAKLMSDEAYEQQLQQQREQEKQLPVTIATGSRRRSSASASAAPAASTIPVQPASAPSEPQKKRYEEAEDLPSHVHNKAFLVSDDLNAYYALLASLIENADQNQAIQELMQQPLDKTLLQTPYIKAWNWIVIRPTRGLVMQKQALL